MSLDPYSRYRQGWGSHPQPDVAIPDGARVEIAANEIEAILVDLDNLMGRNK
jgi:hypothetical protein